MSERMKKWVPLSWLTVLCCVIAAISFADVVVAAPPVPDTPTRVDGLLYARAFTLENGFSFDWRAERPLVTEGTLLVLEVDPDLIFPREVAEPVLFVGSHTAERISRGNGSGRVVAYVPARVDLSVEPIWFGRPELPERVDAATIAVERQLAQQAGIVPLHQSVVVSARQRGGEDASFDSRTELLAAAQRLIIEYVEPFADERE
ncbi:MAG: hypothetical protein JSV80_02055 [Acidobacteriota bacterium]|nr:MAG: hypothetical protein JSV80_02055 [Acidobacteriota bacterium]